MRTILQVALDFVDLKRALKLAEEAVAGGCDWLEAGTPLIKSDGLNVIRELRKKFPQIKIVADMKIADVGRLEVEIAAKAGANIVTVLGSSDDETIKEAISAGKNYGAEIMVDLLGVQDVVKRAKEVEKLGVNYIDVHIPIDEQMKGKISLDIIKKISSVVKIPVAIAGGINSENAADAVKAGASIIIVGGAITKSQNAKEETQKIKKAISQKIKIKSEFFQRVTESDIRKILNVVSCANVSDALHRGFPLKNVFPVVPSVKMVGPAVTVRTYPGDWAKPVQAIDLANEGDVIVIDAGGVTPAVWGELATNSAINKKISGVVISGGIRDTQDIKKLKFPAFATMVTPQAGEPKGFGEINIPIMISGVKINSGDWIVGDDDGVMVIPKESAVEFTNRAMDVLEKENRLRREIQEGSSLAKVAELLKWEKK
ncbi:MAG: bifunctional hexulose-6-phosphate synthase/ribonuclease regulator [Elusimicrobia bacterium RIFOXYD2_FULL_34_15]|nr:MAG: bifunctional hexulose-6-phosphate synthase/ribonuclease regulator [Elusimicrobia bacterium RIFOXYD2_FULL_34_15]